MSPVSQTGDIYYYQDKVIKSSVRDVFGESPGEGQGHQ